MMKRDLAENSMKNYPHRRTAVGLFLTPSLHHVRHGRHTFSIDDNIVHSSSRHVYEQQRKPDNRSTSNASFDSYLKDANLSEKDFDELKKALGLLFYCTQIGTDSCAKQRLTSPYLQSKSNNHQRGLLPLYTNERFIRKGLLNHNDGPEIHHTDFSLCDHRCSEETSSSASLTNRAVPLALVANENYFLTAMTSNFALESLKRSQSESDSILLRRKKVQAWERNNILEQTRSITSDSSPQNDPLTNGSLLVNDDQLHVQNAMASPIGHQEQEENTQKMFPMVKALAPYIIIRDTRPRTSNNLKMKTTEKRPFHGVSHSPKVTSRKRRGLVLKSTIDDLHRQQHHRRNFLLAEFDSLLTKISKE